MMMIKTYKCSSQTSVFRERQTLNSARIQEIKSLKLIVRVGFLQEAQCGFAGVTV